MGLRDLVFFLLTDCMLILKQLTIWSRKLGDVAIRSQQMQVLYGPPPDPWYYQYVNSPYVLFLLLLIPMIFVVLVVLGLYYFLKSRKKTDNQPSKKSGASEV